ncbi:sensor histidine kinase [Sinimarinibacterium thermocellulolyticum]|uniref:histidine kinase n=1 Tax=Sinimarinibacterium thermocellulolyticum TaxID=3170016 RepID=A0ABV2ABR8_9GAMM
MKASTTLRLTLAAILALLVLLPAAGWLINDAFERSALASFDERLRAHVEALAGRTGLAADGRIRVDPALGELRFTRVFSGWYWQVAYRGEVVATSRSLWDSSLPITTPGNAAFGTLSLQGPRGERLRACVLRMQTAGLDDELLLTVTAPMAEVELETAAFRRLLIGALGALGLMLAVGFALQIHWGLAPLRRMAQTLRTVRSGHAQRLDTDLPSDLAQIALTMNEVLDHHDAMIQRARTSAGNLAHALKTPLANLRLEAERASPDGAALKADLQRIETLVEHHLTRAGAAGKAAAGRRTAVRTAIEPVLDAVRGIYRGRGIEIDARFDADAEVRVDAQDLQELVGNLLDNAAKWAARRVELHCQRSEHMLRLSIDDDGPGIPAERLDDALRRGVQLDEQRPGAGLGLAIVRDIAALYDLRLELGPRPGTGLRAQLWLPLADHPNRNRP